MTYIAYYSTHNISVFDLRCKDIYSLEHKVNLFTIYLSKE
ncbi:hypothetical protein HMPREF9445_03279 [Bacteroides clarus YIT 12056]|uniref:Uncharacterized protein n=1 Tax=Bacteroides clarus YIT 12056 TaxID=762984 RepID=A0ABN0CJF7_9BACE|nr:hypothetical protein HMPREF9445_03279 [Bacteroides clarus YIT 12056]